MNNLFNSFQQGLFYANKYWFMARDYNGLFKMDSDNNIEFDSYITGELKVESGQFSAVIGAKEKLYFIPLREDKVVIYDVKKHQYSKIYVDEKYRGTLAFTGALHVGKFIYSFGLNKWVIMRIDTETDELHFIDDFAYDLEKEDDCYCSSYYMGSQAINKEGSIIIPLRAVKGILLLDPIGEKYEIVRVECNGGFYSVSELGGKVYCGPDSINNPIICLNERYEVEKEIEICKGDTYGDNPLGMIRFCDKLCLFSKDTLNLRLDKRFNVVENYSFDYTDSEGRIVLCSICSPNTVYVMQRDGNIKKIEIEVGSECKAKLFREFVDYGHVWDDNLGELVSMISD